MNELVQGFMNIMSQQPLSLALVVMNLLLLWYCFKLTSSFAIARGETTALIVSWQKESQAIMADCVSKENLQLILSSLERDRETYRAMMPTFKSIQKVTETESEPKRQRVDDKTAADDRA